LWKKIHDQQYSWGLQEITALSWLMKSGHLNQTLVQSIPAENHLALNGTHRKEEVLEGKITSECEGAYKYE
jgi:D-mannonate dehydratase